MGEDWSSRAEGLVEIQRTIIRFCLNSVGTESEALNDLKMISNVLTAVLQPPIGYC